MNDMMMHLLDIIQNSIYANANDITIKINVKHPFWHIGVHDNGFGMSIDKCNAVQSPYTTTRATRKVGLGIPLFIQTCQQAGGNFQIYSKEGQGTQVEASIRLDHIDCPPIGNIGECFYLLISTNEQVDFNLEFTHEEKQFYVSSKAILEAVEGVSLYDIAIKRWIIDYVNENVIIKEGGSNENFRRP